MTLARRTGQGRALVTLLGAARDGALQLLDLDARAAEAEAAEEVRPAPGAVPHLLHFALWIGALVHHVRGEAAEAERARPRVRGA